ncbi:MAG: helicase-associated domain-containing protein [Candidatus Sumerlaeia bacterium]
MKLKTHLHETSLERLRAIAEFWGLQPPPDITADDPAALAEFLYPRMQTAANLRAAFDRLDASQRQLVYLLALHGGELPVDEMRRRCGMANQQELLDAIEPLADRGLVWREKVRDKLISLELVGIAEPFVRLIELPPYWQGFLGYYLQELGTDELRSIARNTLGERPVTRKKQALVHYLRRRLLDPKTLQEILAKRDALQIEMFEQILARNGVCAWKDLLDAGAHKKFDHVRAERLRDLVEHSGLVFVLKATPNKYNNLLMVPRDVAFTIQNGYRRDERTLEELSRLGSADSRPSPGHESLAPRPGVILDNSNNILRDLVIVLAYIQRNHVKMLNNGGIGRNDLKKIVPLMSYNKTIKYVGFLALFSITRKLIIVVGDQWRVSSTLEQWLEKGQGCYRDLFEFWLNANEWNEEYVDGDVIHADNYPQNLISITELRKLVLRMIERLPADQWIDFETFAGSLLPQIALEIPGRNDITPADKFNRHPTLILESVVAEALYWLGVVLLGVADLEVARRLGSRPNEAIAPYDPSRPLLARQVGEANFMFSFRPTGEGRTLLGRPYLEPDKLFAKMPDPELPFGTASDYFTVQPNLEIVTPPDFNLTRFYRLLLFANIKKVDIMTTLSISRESVRSGLDNGLSAESIMELLDQCSRKQLPETVRQIIGECETRHGELDVGMAGGYLKVADRMRLEELRANPKIAPYIKDVFENRLILLSRSADFKKIVRELQRMGLMPRIDSDSLYVTSDGLFQVTLRAEELYDLLALVRFAIMLEEENGATLFDDRPRSLFERLSVASQDRFNPRFYAESIAKAFYGNYEKFHKKAVEEQTRKYRKQVTRLMSQMPRKREAPGFKGVNPASDPGDVQKLLRHAIENEIQVRIQYERSSGETTEEMIEPEAFQGHKIYALNPADDEHHVYALDRIKTASI